MRDPEYDEDEEFLSQEEVNKHNQIYHLYASLGLFIAAYSKVELALTVLMAEILQNKDYEAFHTLTRGLDGPAKAGRVKELGEAAGIYEHKNAFGTRLNLFKETIVNFRNRISHSYITLPADHPILGFYDISYITKDPKRVEYVASKEMIEHCTEWVDYFFEDLMPTIQLARERTKLTIAHPQSMEPERFRQTLQKLATAAKRRIRPKKALRKSK